MKRLTFLLTFTLLFSLNYSFGQILQNSSFEVWVQDTFNTTIQGFNSTSEFVKPEGWMTPNKYTRITVGSFVDLDTSVTRKDSTNSLSGTYAARMETRQIDVPVLGQTINVPGAVTNGDFTLDIVNQDFSVSGGNEVSSRPSAFNGFFKYDPQGNDSLLVSVVARSWDSGNQEAEIVGQGFWTYKSSQSTYKEFTVPVEYTSCKMPDTVLVSVLASASQQGNPGSVMHLDSVSLDTFSAQANLPTFANDDDTSTVINQAVTISVTDNDVDCDDPLQSPSIVNGPSNGSILNTTDTTITYEPSSGYSGTDNFRYKISGGQDEDTARVNVEINSAPQAMDDGPFQIADTLSIDVQVTDNDSDPESNAIEVTSIASAPSNGNASTKGEDSVTYTPDDGYTGSDELKYELCDNGNPELCDTATVEFDVVTGIATKKRLAADVNIFPNPAQDKLYIDLQSKTSRNRDYEVSIINITGTTLRQASIQEGRTSIDVTGLAQGLYLFEIRTEKAELVERGKFSISY